MKASLKKFCYSYIKGRLAKRLMFSPSSHALICKFQINCKSDWMTVNWLIFTELYSWIQNCCSFVGLENEIPFLISKYMFVPPAL